MDWNLNFDIKISCQAGPYQNNWHSSTNGEEIIFRGQMPKARIIAGPNKCKNQLNQELKLEKIKKRLK